MRRKVRNQRSLLGERSIYQNYQIRGPRLWSSAVGLFAKPTPPLIGLLSGYKGHVQNSRTKD